MTCRALALPAARESLATHGRSFHWASQLLGRQASERVAHLYAFCRRVDDLVDEQPAVLARRALRSLRADLARGRSEDGQLEAFLELLRDCRMSGSALDCFLATLEQDLGAVRIASRAHLVRYAHGVAGTVGLLMCDALGAEAPEARPFAIDLGVAMQLTNIARDVLEDAGRNRLYLPRTALSPGVTPAALLGGVPRARREAHAAVLGVLDLAEGYYRSADRGLRFLPGRSRPAVRVASRLYEGIGDEIRRRSPAQYFEGRATVGGFRKLGLTARALLEELVQPGFHGSGDHEAWLHVPIRSLPGADPAA